MADKENYKLPLGEIVDLNKRESDRLLNLPFESFRKHEKLSQTVEAANEEMNVFRRRFGLPDLALHDNDVRIVDRTAYEQDHSARKHSEGGAFFHPLNRAVFYQQSKDDVVAISYALTHEMAHRAMEKNGLSVVLENEPINLFRLNEGLADWLAKGVLNSYVLPLLLPSERLAGRQRYLDTVKPNIEGVALEADDILFSARDNTAISYSYLPELKLIEYFESNRPALLDSLLRAGFMGDPKSGQRAVIRALGDTIARELIDLRVPTTAIFKKISKNKKVEG